MYIETNFTTIHYHQRTDAVMQTQTEYRNNARSQGIYDIHIEIDIDCEELVDACDLEYERSDQDDTQNVIILSMDAHEYNTGLNADVDFNNTDEQGISPYLLNPELGEYTTKVTVYKPTGDIISFC